MQGRLGVGREREPLEAVPSKKCTHQWVSSTRVQLGSYEDSRMEDTKLQTILLPTLKSFAPLARITELFYDAIPRSEAVLAVSFRRGMLRQRLPPMQC